MDLGQTFIDLTKKAFGDVVRQYDLAIWLLVGHGGVISLVRDAR